MDRGRARQSLSLAIPILGGLISENVLTLVDILMVSRLGAKAVAAVGFGGAVTLIVGATVMGLGNGVQTMVARRQGEGRHDAVAMPLNAGLVAVTAFAIPLSLLLIWLSPDVLGLLSTDDEIVAIATPYLRVRLAGVVALGWDTCLRGFWTGTNRSRMYLRIMLVTHAVDVVSSYVLIFGTLGLPRLGVLGSGAGTTLGMFVGVAYSCALALQESPTSGVLRRFPPRDQIATLLRLAIPSALQLFSNAAVQNVLFAILGRVGTGEAAAANVVLNISWFVTLPCIGIGLASVSLVGQALGRGDVADAERWGWDGVRIAAVVMIVLGLPLVIAPETILRVFFSDDPRILALAATPLRISGLALGIEALVMGLLFATLGAGANRVSMILTVGAQWAVFVPAAWIVGPVLGFGLIGIWIVNASYRLVLGILLSVYWRRRQWVSVKV